MERFTFKKTHPYYKPGEEFPCIVAKDLIVVTEHDTMDDVFNLEFRPKEYVADPAIDRLYDYEELGYTPEELREIIRKYERYERMLKSPNGLTMDSTHGHVGGWKEFAMNAIDRASKDRDISVSALFNGAYVSISVYPWPEEEPDDNT